MRVFFTISILVFLIACGPDQSREDWIDSFAKSYSSSSQKYAFCVYSSIQYCVSGQFTTCPENGLLMDYCPFTGQYSSSSRLSSSSLGPSSSSSSPELSSSSNEGPCDGFVDGTEREHYDKIKKQFCDKRDGKKYVYVIIGSQIWMAENLNYDVPDNTTDVCYSNNSNYCITFGRLYNWATAMNLPSNCNSTSCSGQVQGKHQGICPDGWHVPSDDDWSQLFNYVGGSSVAGKHLKAKSGWYACGPSGSGSSYVCSDTYGFSALPGGYGLSGGNFDNVGDYGYWWSASEGNSYRAYLLRMSFNLEDAHWYNDSKTFLFSVRCVQD